MSQAALDGDHLAYYYMAAHEPEKLRAIEDMVVDAILKLQQDEHEEYDTYQDLDN